MMNEQSDQSAFNLEALLDTTTGSSAMQTIYNSDNYAVVQIPTADGNTRHGGFEIVDKHMKREIFIDGQMAEQFSLSVQALFATEPEAEDVDDFLAQFDALMHQPLTLQ